MLTDREQETWREIQRRLVDDQDVHPVERHGPGDHHRSARLHPIVVALTLVVLLLIGPNLLTDAEIADRQQPPRPHESPAPAGLDSDAYAIGVAWAPARESRGPAGPTDIPVGGHLGATRSAAA